MNKPPAKNNRGRSGPARYSDASGGRYIIGINPVAELLKLAPERVLKLNVQQFKGKLSLRKQDLVDQIKRHKIELEFLDVQDLDVLAGTDSHQGFVALVQPNQPSSLKEFLQRVKTQDKAFVIMLDGVEDPHNLGAVFRASECFGVDAIAWSSNKGPSLTPVVSKSSAGASEIVNYFTVSNITESLKKLKKEDFWVVGAAVGEGSSELQSFEYPNKTVLVMGAEGRGLSRLVGEILDFSVHIPMSGQLDSLNVSQATAVFLHQWKSKQGGV